MSEPDSSTLSNLKLSNNIIALNPATQSGELVLTNMHESHTLYFKIKTKIQKILDVKPFTGFINPGESQTISFKPFKKIEPNQIANLQQKLQFLLQAVNSKTRSMTKQQEVIFWKDLKAKKISFELGFCSVKLGITFSPNKHKQTQLLPQFNKFQSKIDSRFSSEVKSVKQPLTMHNLPASSVKLSTAPKSAETITDIQLSKKYEQLKQKEESLIKRREKLFEVEGGKQQKKKGGKSFILLIILLIVSFLLGNYLKLTTKTERNQQLKSSKGWFS